MESIAVHYINLFENVQGVLMRTVCALCNLSKMLYEECLNFSDFEKLELFCLRTDRVELFKIGFSVCDTYFEA